MSQNLIEIVQIVESLQRIPVETPAAITYFSEKDEWVYYAVMDNRVCEPCLQFEWGTFKGNELRATFPYLEIKDIDLILPHVHPNCRCNLWRVLFYGDIGVEK